jgi:hypothetical protein
VSVAAVLERMQRDPRARDYPRTAMVVLATASADGAPLNRPDDRIVLVRAVHLIGAEGMAVRPALARAREEPVSSAALRGIVRWASSRLASPVPLELALAEHSADTLQQLEPRELADVTRRLLLVAPDQRIVDPLWEALRTFDARIVPLEPAASGDVERQHEGELLGACVVCGAAVGRDDSLFAVWRSEQRDWRQIAWKPGKRSDTGFHGYENVKRKIAAAAPLLCDRHVVRCLRLKWEPIPIPDAPGGEAA